ncbi:MAG TPA: phosphoribosyltransferase family protein [Kofleriaceae bacterium]|nr:phosphoribosyltransferase family protein [Kofleriaceae bacterium]
MLGRHDAIEEIHVPAGDKELRGSLGVPQGPVGLVLVAGTRDPYVAEALRARGLATLVIDLELHRDEHFDIDLLATRLAAVTDWVIEHSHLAHLPIGYLGGDTCAAAALVAASRRPELVRAIALSDGRADLAGSALPLVRAPTLFVAPGNHDHGLDVDRAAIDQMSTSTQLAIIPGAGPSFDEPGTLDELVQLAAEWLVDHFAHALAEPASRRGSWGRQFRDRRAAGERLAHALAHHAGKPVIVCGLPRGGVPVADEIAKALGAPLDVWLVRKIGMPIQPELGMGALAEGAALVLDPTIVKWSGATPGDLQRIVHAKAAEIRRRAQLYRGNAPILDVRGKTVILVDDGIATGGTLRAAVRGARKRGAARVIVAAPVAAAEAAAALRAEADDLVCLATPRHLNAVGAWYQSFRQLPEHEVIEILAAARARSGSGGKVRAGA